MSPLFINLYLGQDRQFCAIQGQLAVKLMVGVDLTLYGRSLEPRLSKSYLCELCHDTHVWYTVLYLVRRLGYRTSGFSHSIGSLGINSKLSSTGQETSHPRLKLNPKQPETQQKIHEMPTPLQCSPRCLPIVRMRSPSGKQITLVAFIPLFWLLLPLPMPAHQHLHTTLIEPSHPKLLPLCCNIATTFHRRSGTPRIFNRKDMILG